MESKNMSRNVSPIDGQSQVMKSDSHILDLRIENDQRKIKFLAYLFEKELEFSKSLSSPIICPDDMDDSNCLAKHCSVLKISLLWHPYSFLRMIGNDSAKLTLWWCLGMFVNMLPIFFCRAVKRDWRSFQIGAKHL